MSSQSVTLRIPDDVLNLLPPSGKGRSKVIVSLLRKSLELPQGSDDGDFPPAIKALQDDVRQLQIELQSLKDIVLQNSAPGKLKQKNKSPKVPISTATEGEWLTTGEAYTMAQSRGYTKTKGTFRRTLREEGITPDLEALGLEADFEARSQANPRDNRVKWLKFCNRKQ